MIKFIHTSDLHLDTPFRGLSAWNSELAGRLKDATFKSFSRIIDLCIDEQVDFLVVSGDSFDGENRSLAAQLRFVSELKRLSDQGIATYLVCGNHDPLNSWLDTLEMPPLVHRFGGSEVEVLSHEKDGQPLADICGISFQQKDVGSNLAARFRRKDKPAPISVAIMHGTVGAPGPHHSYAPFKLDDIRGMGFDYWALGHIHKHLVVQQASPAVVYPGNPQGRDFGETGPKGCCLVEISPNQHPMIRFMPTHCIRFEDLTVDLTGVDSLVALSDKISKAMEPAETNMQETKYVGADGSAIVRLTLMGRTDLHAQLNQAGEIDQLLEHLNNGQLQQSPFTWIDHIEPRTRPMLDPVQLRNRNDFAADVLRSFETITADDELSSALIRQAAEQFASFETKRELEELTAEEQQEIIEKAKWMLLDSLLKGEA